MSERNQCWRRGCEKTAKYRCERCDGAEYCSPECQKIDWNERHSELCGTLVGGKCICEGEKLCVSGDNIEHFGSKRVIEKLKSDMFGAAFELKKKLSQHGINLVTVESLTSGLIASSLTDIPGDGSVLYGGHIVYDTDAKRMWSGVTTRGVYSEKTASQMAVGTLIRSRAIVCISVTGHAMPLFEDRDKIGMVDVGVAIRVKNLSAIPEHYVRFDHAKDVLVSTCRIEFCENKNFKPLCEAWKKLHSETGTERKYPPWQLTSLISDAVRLYTTKVAMEKAKVVVIDVFENMKFQKGDLPPKSWDEECPPSKFIAMYISGTHPYGPEPRGEDETDLTKQHSSDII